MIDSHRAELEILRALFEFVLSFVSVAALILGEVFTYAELVSSPVTILAIRKVLLLAECYSRKAYNKNK